MIMRRRSPALVGLAMLATAATFGPAGLTAQTAELRGRVTEVHDARARVELESERAPAAGSPAEIYEVIDDLGEVPVAGRWSVAEIGDGFVWIAAAGEVVTPTPGQYAKIRPAGLVGWPRTSESDLAGPVVAEGPWPGGATELFSTTLAGDPLVMDEWSDGCVLERRDGAVFQRNGRSSGSCHFILSRLPELRSGRGYAATMVLLAGAQREAIGLTFGAGDGAYYTYQIDAGGSYAVMLNDGETWSEITPWTWRAEIRPGLEAPNRLALVVEDRRVRLFANGQPLDVVELPRSVTGFGGFYVDEPGQTVRFDDLQVVELGGGGGN